jgi:hypothetical protein
MGSKLGYSREFVRRNVLILPDRTGDLGSCKESSVPMRLPLWF